MAQKLDATAVRIIDGETYIRITPGRARHLADAIRLGTPHVTKSARGVVESFARTLDRIGRGETLDPSPRCSVYVRAFGREATLVKIGHARDVAARSARATDTPDRLVTFAAWEFGSVAEAMERERFARSLFPKHDGTGGSEFVVAAPGDVVERLSLEWGGPELTPSEA